MIFKNIGILFLLVLSLLAPSSVEAKSYNRPVSKASPAPSSAPVITNSPAPASKGFVNSNPNNNNRNKDIIQANDNAKAPDKPVEVKSISIKAAVTNTKPPNAVVSQKVYKVDNPTNLPTKTYYSTRYGSDNRPYTVSFIAPIGYNTNLVVIPNDYYGSPATAYTSYGSATRPNTTIIDNTPTNGFDLMIVLVVIVGIILVIVVFGFFNR